MRTEGSAAVVDAALAAGVGRVVQESVSMLYRDQGDRWIDEDAPVDHFPLARGNFAAESSAHRFGKEGGGAGVVLRFGWFYGPGAAHSEQMYASLTRSLRVSNARFREATGWAPRYPSAREGWLATAAALT